MRNSSFFQANRGITAIARSLILSALTLTALTAQTTVTTIPEGVITYTIKQAMPPTRNFTTFSIPLTEQSVFQGTVSSVTTDSISATTPGWVAGAFSSVNSPYAVRLTSGIFSGKVLVISTTTPNTINTITLSDDGVSLVGRVVSGDTFEIFPCDTLQSLFGSGKTNGLQSVLSGTRFTADEVTLVQNGAWTTYYYDSAALQWRSGALPYDMGNTVIHPNAGILYGRRASTDFTFNVLGRVASVDQKITYNTAGVSFVSVGVPTDMTLSSLALNSKISGWVNKTGITTSGFDQVGIFDGTAWSYYNFNGTQWRNGTLPYDMGNVAIPTGTPVLVKRASGTSTSGTFTVPLTYSLN